MPARLSPGVQGDALIQAYLPVVAKKTPTPQPGAGKIAFTSTRDGNMPAWGP